MEINLSCLIIEDEPIAQQVIENHIQKVPFLTLLKKSNNAIEGFKDIQELKPDLVFLDIQMPEMSGLEMLKILQQFRPQIILTTAFPQFALEGFEMEVSDYLLKPISFDRFYKAVYKVYDHTHTKRELSSLKETYQKPGSPREVFWVKEGGKSIQLTFKEVHMVTGLKDYVQIHLEGRNIITYLTMKRMEEVLPDQDFMRVSRSCIIQKSSIRAINGNMIETALGDEVLIGPTYREAIKSEIQEWFR
ncbi:LytR/AlgR family response regulator transcription factor [Litoribacter populi]|uniref:LytR/AlgR family response regulator transcription factor n=1 Tax=Litoribacter populi TaxID=2598460 RepID=UPI00117C3AB0|nr:LytTR family DNA-binding domain-containing protein [Litoribacter populi]